MDQREGGGVADFDAAPRDDVDVVVCTRNRPESLDRALRSVLASDGVDFEVTVVDQSDDELTDAVVRGLASPRLHYHRSATRGLGAGLAEAFESTERELIVRIDDDCEVDRRWVAGMAEALRLHPRAGVVCSNVVAPADVSPDGYVPSVEHDADHVTRSVFGTRDHGLGAGIAYRRTAVADVGGPDAALGVGSRFRSCEDWDMQLRMVLRGWWVFHASKLQVIHHGFRSDREGRQHTRNSWFGIGAMFAKLLRISPAAIAVLAVWKFGTDAVLPPLDDLIHIRPPRGLTRITAFCGGFVLGLRATVDTSTMRFRTPNGGSTDPPSR